MSYNNQIIYGDVDILTSTDNNGVGDLSVANNVSILGTTSSTSSTTGALTVAGGVGIN